MTEAEINDVLARGYAHAVGVATPGAPDPAAELVAAVVAEEVTVDALRARRVALQSVEVRCAASRVRRQFLDRVLAAVP